jgi:hypothetical protein
MCDIGGERADVWALTTQRARRRYVCETCGLPIVTGILYDRVGYLYDGRWSTIRAHTDCHELTRYIQLDLCGQHTYSIAGENHLREEVRQHLIEYNDLDIRTQLISQYRAVLRARIREGVWPARRAA